MEELDKYCISNAPKYPLMELLEFIVDNRGKTVPTSDTGIALIATNCIRNECLYPKYEKIRYVSDEIYRTWFRSHPQPGDIIFVNKGTPGRTALVPDPVDFCIAQDMMAFRVKKDVVYNKYLLAVLRSRDIQQFIFNSQVGTIIPHFKKEQLKSLLIPLPKMDVQKRIGDFYFSFSEKEELNRRINENLEAQAQTLFKSWFVDFEPFKDGEFVESEMGMIPKGWSIQKAQDVFEMNIGKTPPRKEKEWFTESTDDIIWVSIADMGSCGVFISDSSEYLTIEAIRKYNILMVEKDSVLLSFKLTIGRVAIADTKLTTNEAIARFILPDKSYREFLYLYLKRYEYGSLGSTSSIATAVNSKTIKGMKLLMPDVDIIKEFSHKARPLFEQIRINQQESRRLAQLRDTLLPRLMSGELKVNEIEMH